MQTSSRDHAHTPRREPRVDAYTVCTVQHVGVVCAVDGWLEMTMSSSSSSDDSSDDDDDDDYLRPYNWSALAQSDSSGIVKSFDSTTFDKDLPFGEGHTLHHGPPYLLSTLRFGHLLCGAFDSSGLDDEAVKQAFCRGITRVSVDWGPNDLANHPLANATFTLLVRHRGEILQRREGCAMMELSVEVNLKLADPGECIIIALEWPNGGFRHLHLIGPPVSSIPLSGTTAAPFSRAAYDAPPPREVMLAAASVEYLTAETANIDRGFGLELELMTASVRGVSKAREWSRLIASSKQQLQDGKATSEHLERLLDRCAQWNATSDLHIMTSSSDIAEGMVQAEVRRLTEAQDTEAAESLSASEDWLVALTSGSDDALQCVVADDAGSDQHGEPSERLRTHKSEYVSPPPPNELSLMNDACSEIACAVRLIRHRGASAPTISRVWHGGASVHCHVNVTNPGARGELLRTRDVLSLFFSWVRYDLVTCRLVRPWFWREPSSAPLFATGAEFAWVESGFDQGSRAHPQARFSYDVPQFIAGCRRVVNSADYDRLSQEAQMELLFGGEPKGTAPGDTPGALLGRYGSMNLRRLTSYGTVEIRRFHGSLDEGALIRWAAFCVAFVEYFRQDERGQRLCDAVLSNDDDEAAAGLRELQRAQEMASVEELIGELRGVLDPATISWLLTDACNSF